MNWDDLRYVLAAMRGRNMSAAAAALSVTHTTVSRRLRSCEEELGVRLFDRTPEGLVPTPAGQELADLAERMEVEVLATEGRIRGRDAALRGDLRVSTLDFLYGICLPAFTSFQERHPAVELTLTTPMQSVSLNRREADVALRLTNAPPPGLVGRRVGRLTFAPYASPALVERIGAGQPLGAYPWIAIDERMDALWMDAWLAEHAPGATIVARVDENALVIRQMVTRGIGVFFLPLLEGEALGLRRLEPTVDQQMEVWVLTLPDLRLNSRVRAFLDHMGQALPTLLTSGC